MKWYILVFFGFLSITACQQKNEVKIDDLFSVEVQPINDIVSGFTKGHYENVDQFLNDYDHPDVYKSAEHIFEPSSYQRTLPDLSKAAGSKRIYFVPVTQDLRGEGCEEWYVRKFGLTLCKEAPNYLLGAMATLSKNKIPKDLLTKEIVAMNAGEPLFTDEYGRHDLSLSVVGSGDRRLLSLAGLSGEYDYWSARTGWVFLAEKP